MSLTASTLIDAAKTRTYGATGGQKVSDAALLGELSYQDQLITQMFAQINPDLLATISGTITCSDAGNLNGYTLQPAIHYRDFVHCDVSEDEYTPISIIQRQWRDRTIPSPSATLRLSGSSGVFYPIDPLGHRWVGSESREWFEPDTNHTVTYSYVPLAQPLSTLSSTLRSPDMAYEVLVTSLELTILLSNPLPNEARIQAALMKRQGMMDSLRMQAYKFLHPAGHRPGDGEYLSDSEWVQREVTG